MGCHDTGSPKGPPVWGPRPSNIFPLAMEVEQRLRGDSTRALVQGLSALDSGLCNGHSGRRGALAVEVKARSDAKKGLARDERAQARARGTRGGAPAGRHPQGGAPPPPTALARGISGLRGPNRLVACQWMAFWVRAALEGRCLPVSLYRYRRQIYCTLFYPLSRLRPWPFIIKGGGEKSRGLQPARASGGSRKWQCSAS